MNLPITGICDTVTYTVNRCTSFTLGSKTNAEYSMSTSALIVPKITTLASYVSYDSWPHLHGLDLVDPQMDSMNRIDVLLGAATHAEIILDGLIKGQPGQPIAQRTKLGWMVSGGGTLPNCSAPIFTIQTEAECLSKCLMKFWETDELPREKIYTQAIG